MKCLVANCLWAPQSLGLYAFHNTFNFSQFLFKWRHQPDSHLTLLCGAVLLVFYPLLTGFKCRFGLRFRVLTGVPLGRMVWPQIPPAQALSPWESGIGSQEQHGRAGWAHVGTSPNSPPTLNFLHQAFLSCSQKPRNG